MWEGETLGEIRELLEHDEEIQRSVFFSVATLLNLEVDLIFSFHNSTI